jgi:hypothetical protein
MSEGLNDMDKCKYCNNHIKEEDLLTPTIVKGKYICCECTEKMYDSKEETAL